MKIVFKNIDKPEQHQIENYIKSGGYKALPQALKNYTPDQVIDIVKKSGLRGRGGAGFPAGVKWGFVPKSTAKPKYLCVNADESEPGTFKDREIMEKDPHLMIEGAIISSYAISAHTSFIYIRGEFTLAARRIEQALKEAYSKTFLGKNILNSGYDLEMYLFRGAGAYICGEETALLDSLEGKRGLARVKPPFPAIEGLYRCPTVVNNVETLSNVPDIILKGGEWFASIGTPKSTGTKIFSLSGHVNKPGNYELTMGTPLRHLIYDLGGGIKGGRKFKAAFPGGPSVPLLIEKHLDTPLDFESLQQAGSMLGSGAVIVMDETTCMVEAARILVWFFRHESCGKCTPCREGTMWLHQVLDRIEDGQGRTEDIDLLLRISDNIGGKTICALGDAAIVPVQSTIQYFREEYEYHVKNKKCLTRTQAPFN